MAHASRAVAYSDLLGFSDLVVSAVPEATQLLSDFYNAAQNLKTTSSFADLELFLFSDFLFVQGDHVEDVVNYMCALYRQALDYSAHSAHPMLIRGGIASGSVFTQRRRAAPLVTKNFVVSPALVHAVHMEGLVRGQRLLLSAREREELQHFWNPAINAICYDQPSIKPSQLFTKYRYQDLLWARDLRKPLAAATTETCRLITIAASLFRSHYQAPVVEHYAETLRICLLSFCSQLQPTLAHKAFIADLVKDTLLPCPNPITWLGFLEMVLLSPDGSLFHGDQCMTDFLRTSVLRPEWSSIQKALQTTEHAQLHGAFTDFLGTALPQG